MADRIAIERDLRQLREDYANAVEVRDDEMTVPTGALGVALAEVARLTPRQITTAEELEVLAEYAVLVDHADDVWQKRYADDKPWVMAGHASEPESSSELLSFAPLLLIHVATAEKEN